MNNQQGQNMRTLVTLLLLSLTTTAMADPAMSFAIQGSASQVNVDLNGDAGLCDTDGKDNNDDGTVDERGELCGNGCFARTFTVFVTTPIASSPDTFVRGEGMIDSGVRATQGGCPIGYIDLFAHGYVNWRTAGGDSIKTVFDPDQAVCYAPGELEHITLTIVGGRGRYAGATGTVDVELLDDVQLYDPVTFCPQWVDVNGTVIINVLLAPGS